MADAACPGFRFAGISCGIKKVVKPDLGLIVADGDVPAAAVFTRNRVRAAPVLVSETHVKAGVARAIATRCFWPPDISAGRCSAQSSRPTFSRYWAARRLRFRRVTPW